MVGGAPPPEASGQAEVSRPPVSGPWDYALLCGVGEYIQRCPSLLPEDEEGLPPLLITTGETDSGGGWVGGWVGVGVCRHQGVSAHVVFKIGRASCRERVSSPV